MSEGKNPIISNIGIQQNFSFKVAEQLCTVSTNFSSCKKVYSCKWLTSNLFWNRFTHLWKKKKRKKLDYLPKRQMDVAFSGCWIFCWAKFTTTLFSKMSLSSRLDVFCGQSEKLSGSAPRSLQRKGIRLNRPLKPDFRK